jgi:RimJ/RimL family protein N-acetyltransferase
MARLIYSMLTSLDGYTADKQGGFGWAAPADEEVHAYVNQLAAPVGAYLYGRRMYETMKTDITVAQSPDLPLVMDIMAEAAAWLQSRGIDQWPSPPNEHWRRRMAGKIAAGEMHLVHHAGQVVGIVGLSWHDDYWPDDGQAGYVHRMAVRNAWHGRGLGREILAWASKTAQNRGCSLLRLDCLASNRRLCHYYERQGFERRAELDDRDYRAALYEKQLEGCGA